MRNFKLKEYCLNDTIVAIATFPSTSALGVVKISGKSSLGVIAKIFKPAKKKNIRKVKTFTIHYGWIVEEAHRQRSTVRSKKKKISVVDEVLVSVMRKPRSYTTEDVVEISCHGGIIVLNNILALAINAGARLALPGEFTYRALLGGRIDLLQAQSIAGIIDAKTDEALSLASSQLQGASVEAFNGLKNLIKDIFVESESTLNFPEDDIVSLPSGLLTKAKKAVSIVNKLVEGADEAKILREGLRCVICGKTNVGKSTLFNCLLKEERVIVSRFKGTTRDVVDEIINIRGVPLRIYDTAGILEAQDLVAKKALEKTHKIFDEADLVILVLDSSRLLSKDDLFLINKMESKNSIIVLNKTDLPSKLTDKDFSQFSGTVVKMSALKNIGLADFEKAIYNNVYKVKLDRTNLVFLSNFQKKILHDISVDLNEALRLLSDGHTVDFANVLFKECLERIGKITGEVYCEEILESIFSQFCIGK
jgi:tRNA modification GTPase